MKKLSVFLTAPLFFVLPLSMTGQNFESQLGAWYMYFWNTTFKQGPFGLMGDIQYRNWNIMGDLEQLLFRGGFTFQPANTDVTFLLGYAHATSGAFGEDTGTISENRIYQDALLPQKVGERFYLINRFRFEQRLIEGQNTRTRWRYTLFLNVPINKPVLVKGTVYLSLLNEVFLNGERNIGNGITVEVFDRNWTYAAAGYCISNNLRTQWGYMLEKTNSYSKGQLQVSLHHKF